MISSFICAFCSVYANGRANFEIVLFLVLKLFIYNVSLSQDLGYSLFNSQAISNY